MRVEEYISASAQTFLFWSRIMKEHAIFIESSLPPTQTSLANQAEIFRKQFTGLFKEVIYLADGVIPKEVLDSGQFCTEFTETAERDFQNFFGTETNWALTVLECGITPFRPYWDRSRQLQQSMQTMNGRLLELLIPFIQYQTGMLNMRYDCKIQFSLYPSALKHLLNEAKRFEQELRALQSGTELEGDSFISFWNVGMSEHAKSLRGQLDWVEENYIRISNDYATAYDTLSAGLPNCGTALEVTPGFGAFAENVTQNTIECRLEGIMSSLYTDHLMREVHHYEYQLKQCE